MDENKKLTELENEVSLINSEEMENEEEIAKLKEENEKLKERQSIMNAVAETHIQEINETHQKYGDMVRKLKSRKMYKDLREEIKELKKEIEELKEEVNTLECKNVDSENVFFDMYGKLEIWGIMEDITPKFMEMWNIVIKRYVKLQEELCLSNTNEKINKCIEVQRLKEELQKSHNHRDHRLHNKLKKENDELKERCEREQRAEKRARKEVYQVCDLIKYPYDAWGSIDRGLIMIEQIQDENKELNDKYEELLKNSFQTESDEKELDSKV